MSRLIFSGHDSFPCKAHWLKRGYDFINAKNNFNDQDAVVKLGVGKNMVSSIRYWMKAFSLLNVEDGTLTKIADYLFNDESGKDKYIEDFSTLWLLHFLLVKTNHASIYHVAFVDFHKQRVVFEKEKLQNYIRRIYLDTGHHKMYNQNTVKRDVAVFLRNYIEPENGNAEDYTPLLIDLNVIRRLPREKSDPKKEEYKFNYSNRNLVDPSILLYAILVSKESNSVAYETLLELALIFCINNNDLVLLIEAICEKYPKDVVYSDVAGIKQLQFKRELSWQEVLDNYYN